jgi:hypothetical protein
VEFRAWMLRRKESRNGKVSGQNPGYHVAIIVMITTAKTSTVTTC